MLIYYTFCQGESEANKVQLASCYLSSPFGLWHHTSEESLSFESCTPPPQTQTSSGALIRDLAHCDVNGAASMQILPRSQAAKASIESLIVLI